MIDVYSETIQATSHKSHEITIAHDLHMALHYSP